MSLAVAMYTALFEAVLDSVSWLQILTHCKLQSTHAGCLINCQRCNALIVSTNTSGPLRLDAASSICTRMSLLTGTTAVLLICCHGAHSGQNADCHTVLGDAAVSQDLILVLGICLACNRACISAQHTTLR